MILSSLWKEKDSIIFGHNSAVLAIVEPSTNRILYATFQDYPIEYLERNTRTKSLAVLIHYCQSLMNVFSKDCE